MMKGADIFNELVDLLYEVSTLIPDQKYRDIMDQLSSLNELVDDKNDDPAFDKEACITELFEARLLNFRLAQEIRKMESQGEQYLLNYVRNNPPIHDIPKELKQMQEKLEKAYKKIDTLTKINAKARFHR